MMDLRALVEKSADADLLREMIGFALLGFGNSAIFPLAMSAAAQRTDRPAPTNVAALAQIAFVAFLLGPPLLGFVGEHCGIHWVYGLGLPFVALSFVVADALGKRQTGAARWSASSAAQ